MTSCRGQRRGQRSRHRGRYGCFHAAGLRSCVAAPRQTSCHRRRLLPPYRSSGPPRRLAASPPALRFARWNKGTRGLTAGVRPRWAALRAISAAKETTLFLVDGDYPRGAAGRAALGVGPTLRTRLSSRGGLIALSLESLSPPLPISNLAFSRPTPDCGSLRPPPVTRQQRADEVSGVVYRLAAGLRVSRPIPCSASASARRRRGHVYLYEE